ncbi:MAG: thiamine pyrophosphate-binding protein, partial [Chloroflexota bacterium]
MAQEKKDATQVKVQAEEKVNVLELCAQMAKEEGMEYMFSLIGGNSITMDTFVQRAGIKRVLFRHEQGCGFAMDAWGRLSRRPGFCVIGPGTGLTNFVTGVTQAYAAGAPGVAIVAESGTMDDDNYGSQGIARSENQLKGVTKWVRRVTYPAHLLRNLKEAFRTAVAPPAGPVAVAYTTEIAGPGIFLPRAQAYTNYVPGWKPREWMTQGDPRLVEELVKWLLEAERPAMVVGRAAHQDDCQDELREFVHLLGLPCSTRRVSRGMISELDPLNYQKARGEVMAQADRCLVFGIRLGFLEGYGSAHYYPPKVKFAQVQDTPDMVSLAINTDIEVTGNLKAVLQQMIQCLKDMGVNKPVAKWDKWRQFVAETSQTLLKKTQERTKSMESSMPIHPDLVGRYTAEVLTEKYNNDYIAIIDGFTASSYFTNWNVAVNTGTVLDASETIGIGHGPGMAVAAGLYSKCEKPIVTLLGDGAVGAGGMDIETAARWNIPAIFLHENNNTLIAGMYENFHAKVAAPTGNSVQDSWQTIHNIRYDRMFAEVGCHTEFVERPEQIKPAIERAIEVSVREKKPSFVECFVDPDVLSSMFGSNPGIALRQAITLTWDQMPDKGKNLMARIMRPNIQAMLPKDWQEGITAMQK